MRKSPRVVVYGSILGAAIATAMPGYAEITNADRLGTALLVEAPAAASASAGSSAPGARGVPTVLADGTVPNRIVVISPETISSWLNVDYGDRVLFLVRQPQSIDRLVEWRFDGLDNMMSYGDIDPYADFAHGVRIYVNQSSNPIRATE